jgi:glutaconyl-CoA/methylmalonyl-CoA decarboxylase subunit gamma
MKKFRITVNGHSYEVEAEVLSDPSPATMVASAPAVISAHVDCGATVVPKALPTASGAPGKLLSPLAGKVVSVDAPVGTFVKTGQKLITLEAMKMNTFVNAPADGTLAEVLVTPGQAVAEGEPLARIK